MAVYPVQAFTKDNIKLRWEERYTSEGLNKKFLGMPRGVYAGFRPQVSIALPTQLDLTVEPNDGYSLIRVQAGSEPVMMDIVVENTVSLDFTGHSVWPVYVVAQADYQVGSDSTGKLITQNTPAVSPQQVTVCKVDRPGNTGPLILSPTTVFPTNDIVARQEPYAFGNTITLTLTNVVGVPAINDVITAGSKTGIVARVGPGYTSVDIVLDTPTGSPFLPGSATFAPSGASATIVSALVNNVAQRFGFMPQGAKQELDVAFTTAQEVVAARTSMDGNAAQVFIPTQPQTTGLPARLTQDLRAASMAARLGLQTVNVRSNTYDLPGLTVDITVVDASTFVIGDLVHSTTGIPQPIGVVRAKNSNILTIHTLQGTFTTGTLIDNGVNVLGSPPGSSSTAIVSIVTNYINVSGSLSARRRANLGNYPAADYTTVPTVSSPTRSVINPAGTEDPNPGPSGIHVPIEGAISNTAITSVLLTVGNVTAPGPIFNPVDGFLPGETITVFDNSPIPVLVGTGIVSTLRYPYLVATVISGSFAGAATAIGAITNTSATVVASSISLIADSLRNSCFVVRADTGERYTVPNVSTTFTDVVYGRLQFSVQDLLPGTLSFQQSSANVNTSVDLRGHLDIGDIIGSPDGRYYEVISISQTQVVLHEQYIGTNALNTSNVPRRRISLFFFTRALPTGSELPYQIVTAGTLPPLQFFFPVWFSDVDSNFDSSILMMTTGEPTVPDATTTIKGKVLLAPNTQLSGPAPNTANDTKAGMVVNVQHTGVNIGPGNYHTINFTTSVPGAVTVGGPGIINISATGPTGPTGPTGSSGGAGNPGDGFTNQDYSFTVTDLPTGAITYSHTYAFVVKFAWISISTLSASGGSPVDVLSGLGINVASTMVSTSGTFTINGPQDMHVGFTVGAAG